jgi:hypothetical protein
MSMTPSARRSDPTPDHNQRFETHDLNLAAYLRCVGHTLVDVHSDPDEPGRAVFAFAESPERERDIEKFFDESGTVSAIKFGESLRLMKARIYRRGPRG